MSDDRAVYRLPFVYDRSDYDIYCEHLEEHSLEVHSCRPGVLAWSLVTGCSYRVVAEAIIEITVAWAKNSRSRIARNHRNISGDAMLKYRVQKEVLQLYAESIGWHRTVLNAIGSRKKTHLDYELLMITDQPLVAQLSASNVAAVIDGRIHGQDPHVDRDGGRMVYSIWTPEPVTERDPVLLKQQTTLSALSKKATLLQG